MGTLQDRERVQQKRRQYKEHSYEHSMKSARRPYELGLEKNKLESVLTQLNIIIYVSRSNRQKQAAKDENKTSER